MTVTSQETVPLARAMSRAGILVPILQWQLEGDTMPGPYQRAVVL